MKPHAVLLVAVLGTGAGLVSATGYSQTTVETRPVIVMGEIVRYEPGHVIVVRNSSGSEVTYNLGPSLVVPEGVEVGRRVTLYTSRGDDGSTMVTRVTTSVTPAGDVKRTVERTRTSPEGEATTTTTTTVNGVVQSFEPGRSITITRPDGTQVTYMVNERSHLPAGLAVGRTVYIRPMMVSGSEPLAGDVTYTETKTKTEHGRTVTRTKTKTVH